MSATVEQLASQIQVLLDDAFRRGVQQGLRHAAQAVEQLIPDAASPGWMEGTSTPPEFGGDADDAETTVMQQAVVE